MNASPNEPRRLVRAEQLVLVAYRQFILRVHGSDRLRYELQLPKGLVFAGDGLAVFASGGTDHRAKVCVEVWSGKPPADAGLWDATEEAVLDLAGPQLVLEGATGRIGDQIDLPQPGTHALRAYSAGRQAARDAEKLDLRQGFPVGLETWLIQLWPVAAAR